ncbi:MAG: hypothetical protein IBJ10_01870 [Phycisphaerales bacterium]|nr:hypothetical protein [Phycisphaerales bacterium]
MSLTSEIALHTQTTNSISVPQVASLLALLGADRVRCVMRFPSPDDAWEQHQRWLRNGTPWDDEEYEYIAKEQSAATVAKKIDFRLKHAIFVRGLPPWFRPLRTEIASMPEWIRGAFDINGVHLGLGWRDIVDTDRHTEGRFFARSICALYVSGSGLIGDRLAFEDAILDLGTFKELKAQLESIVGPCGVATTIFY